MNVLSLFDGMSCGQIALERAGIKVDNYYASEIDKYAIQVTMANYPKTIQLGDVTKVHAKDLPKIDLLIGGSPCQGFSFAGKGLNFEDERSKLFFEYVRILNELKPKYFLLENVQMKYEHELVISRYVGCNPIVINSALVSAQNRVRNYWTNINSKPFGMFGDMEADIKQPKDKGILLKDILETDVADKYFISTAGLQRASRKNYSTPQVDPKKANALNTVNNSSRLCFDSGTTFVKVDVNGIPKSNQNKAGCLTGGANTGGNHSDMDLIVQCIAMRGREDETCLTPKRTLYGKQIRKGYEAGKIKEPRKNIQQLEPRNDGKTNTLTSVQKDNLIGNKFTLRRLTEVECERLQTVPDNYTNHVSSTQRYKMLGNGWTVDVVAHIFKFINK